jgi:hypothetical protein
MSRQKKLSRLALAVLLLGALVAAASPAMAKNRGGFTRGFEFDIDGEAYYLKGAPAGSNGATDIPGHAWVQSGPNRIQGKHYNTGTDGGFAYWSSDADDGALLYIVHGVIDTWSAEKAADYAERGYMHYHEFVSAENGGALHPTLVVWLKHHAVGHFTLDGGPAPHLAHDVSPGVDFEFIPNGGNPYVP